MPAATEAAVHVCADCGVRHRWMPGRAPAGSAPPSAWTRRGDAWLCLACARQRAWAEEAGPEKDAAIEAELRRGRPVKDVAADLRSEERHVRALRTALIRSGEIEAPKGSEERPAQAGPQPSDLVEVELRRDPEQRTAALADRFKCSPTTVKRVRQRLGLGPAPGSKARLHADDLDLLRELGEIDVAAFAEAVGATIPAARSRLVWLVRHQRAESRRATAPSGQSRHVFLARSQPAPGS